jgi:RNA-splicing ligase RtcB
MFELNGDVKIFAKTIESEAIGQITQMINSPIGKDAHTRIMPDAHSGAGCVIGTTMKVIDKVCPNTVGVDIGCGVNLIKTDIDFKKRWEELDRVIHRRVPSGRANHQGNQLDENYFANNLLCWGGISDNARKNALKSLGTLGGGNHFIEAYENGYLSVHSGSRNIGLQVAKFYQKLAELRFNDIQKISSEELSKVPLKEREEYITHFKKIKVSKDLIWLEGFDMENYLLDMYFIQSFAEYNRNRILLNIIDGMKGSIDFDNIIKSTHNFIGKDRILRKGAISAYEGEKLVIPLSMRDGILVCIGKGNEDWNYSAPHGAGRLYSRSAAKQSFTLEQYEESMKGIYSTCINKSTLDEAPFCYKDWEEIASLIEPTVEIKERIIPIYNFKASE